jgi:arsenite-transporting ATPase
VKKKKNSARANSSHTPSTLHPFTHRILIFGGKGGVGKTTAASAAALFLLDHASTPERILLFSTDPAHSLSDSLGEEIGDRVVEVARRGASRLEAREMDANAALEQFIEKHRSVLKEIADRGTLLDETDINELLDLSLPGLDEVMALFELSDLDRSQAYTRIVIDTAPSGHTSRLLRLPAVFTGWLSALDRLAEKHRYMVAQFVRGRTPREDEIELFLRELDEKIARVRGLLYDSERAAFTLVTIPCAMSVEETARYFDFLKQESVPVTDIIINRIEREHDKCLYCRARTRSQKPYLKQIVRQFASLRRREVPLFREEVRGFDGLRRFASHAWEEDEGMKGRKSERVNSSQALSRSATPSPRHPVTLSPFHFKPRRLLIFGGKGGVGKTTAAAAAAIAIAERDANQRVLVFSTDPAHSLSDSFDEQVGELKNGVAGQKNLDAMEIDPARWLEGLKERYRRWSDELFDSLTAGSRWEIQFDREAMRKVIELAPPGIDEIAALSVISDLLDEGRYTSIVLDTAPTGHLIRFLELPSIALSWVRTFIKLLLKYKGLVRWDGLAEELVALSKNIKRVVALLTDKNKCEFVGVAIPERMSFEETIRLTEALERLKVPLGRLLINNVVPEQAAEGCDFCAARRRAQQRIIKDFRRTFARSCQLLLAPQQPRDIRGRKLLGKHFTDWQSEGK